MLWGSAELQREGLENLLTLPIFTVPISMTLYETCHLFSDSGTYSGSITEAVYEEIDYKKKRDKLEMYSHSGLCAPLLMHSKNLQESNKALSMLTQISLQHPEPWKAASAGPRVRTSCYRSL